MAQALPFTYKRRLSMPKSVFNYEIESTLAREEGEWIVTFAPYWDLELKTKIPKSQQTGRGIIDLMDHIVYAYQNNIGIEISFDSDPTPQFLYDNTGGEPALSADERWQRDFEEKRRLTA